MYCTLMLPPLSNHRYTRHSHFMCIYHDSQILLHVQWHTDTLTLYTLSLLHGYTTLLFHVLVSPSHGHSNTRNTICHVYTCYTRYHYFMLFHVHVSLSHRYWDSRYYYCMFVNRWYTDTLLHWIPLHGYFVHSYFMFIHYCYIDSPVYMHWLSMYSCWMDHGLYYCYMDIPVFPLHDYITVLILIFSLLDT